MLAFHLKYLHNLKYVVKFDCLVVVFILTFLVEVLFLCNLGRKLLMIIRLHKLHFESMKALLISITTSVPLRCFNVEMTI